MKNPKHIELFTGLLLLFSCVVGIVLANISKFPEEILAYRIDLTLPALHKNLTIKDWINDAGMALFFLLVGLELKREILSGELTDAKKRILPIISAVCGVILPALIFFSFNYQSPENLRGIAIPIATDIAFVYALLLVLKQNNVKSFIVSLAVIDDLIAILVIAIFYTQNLRWDYAFFSLFCFAVLRFLNFRKIYHPLIYAGFAVLLWIGIAGSGIHSTIAGVLFAATVPFNPKSKSSPLTQLTTFLNPIVNYFVLPIFILANSGIVLQEFGLAQLNHPLFYGIFLGLFLGKQLGIFSAVYALTKTQTAKLYNNCSYREMYATSILAGVGFTMSIFIAELAFHDEPALLLQAKIAVILASIVSAVCAAVTYSSKKLS